MKWFKVFMVGVVGAVLAACSSGVGPGAGGQVGQVGKVSISPTKVEVGANQSKSLTATVRDTAGNPMTNVEVSWEVTDGDVAKVATKGKLTATLTGLKSGQTEVYATVSGVQSSAVEVVVSGNDPTPGKGFSGTLYAPQGGNVKGSVVLACVIVGQDCDTKDPRTKVVGISASGASGSFSLEVESASYVLVGLKDVNGNGTFEEGDYFGCVGADAQGNCAIVKPPKQGLELRMETIGGSTNPGGGESSISGQLFAAAGSNLDGAMVFACDATSNKCTALAQVKGTATQAPYAAKVPASKYFVIGWRDLNNNGNMDAGDHAGCYGQNTKGQCAVFDVNGAVTGKDIKLVVLSGTGAQSLSAQLAPMPSLKGGMASVRLEQLEHFLK